MGDGMVSIVVPIYNSEKYLEECLKSIQSQTFTNFECVLVNDGSTDNSETICRRFANCDDRFRLISQKNAGLSTSRNVGMKVSRGEFISFVDSDDTIENDFIEKLQNKIIETGMDIVQCDRYNDGAKEHPNWTKELYYAKDDIFPAYLRGQFYNNVCVKMYRSSLIQDIPFPDGRIYEDGCWTSLVFERCNGAISIPNALYHYRMVPTSITHTRMSERQECGMFRNSIDKAIVVERNISDKESFDLLDAMVMDFIPWVLGSHDDLSLFGTYEKLRQLVYTLQHHGFNNWIYTIINENDDFRRAQRKYRQKVVFSKKNGNLEYKLKVIWRLFKRR